MPHTLSAAKRLRQSKERAARNKKWKTRVKSAIHASRNAIAANAESTQEEVRKAVALIDRAVVKGILHKNAGARKKSRLIRRFNKTKK